MKAAMIRILHDLLVFFCLAAFVTGICSRQRACSSEGLGFTPGGILQCHMPHISADKPTSACVYP